MLEAGKNYYKEKTQCAQADRITDKVVGEKGSRAEKRGTA